MRILQICSGDFFSTYGGGQVYVKNLVDELINQGEDVAVASFVATPPRKCEYRARTIYEINGDEDLRQAIIEARPDVIHAHSHKGVGCAIGAELHIPVVVTSHHGGIVCPAGALLTCDDRICYTPVCHKSCLPCVLRVIRTGSFWYHAMRHLPQNSYIALGRFLRRLPFIPFITPIGCAALSMRAKHEDWQRIIGGCTTMVAPCQRIADALTLNGFPPQRIKVIPHGIPLPKSVPPFPPVIGGAVKFFYVGRISYEKGLHTLIQAFLKLQQPNAELHIIGGSSNKGERQYENRLKKLSHADSRITWHGKLPPEQIFDAIAGYHVSSSSSFLEAFGLNIAESLAMGKPILATRNGGAEQQITDGVNGWLVESENVREMADKMAEICRTLTTFDTMKATAAVHSMAEHTQQLLQVYHATQD